MKLLGLIGNPLEHSFSQKYFRQKFEKEGIEGWDYELYPIEEISELKHLINNPALVGLNVTIPYKQAVIHYLDSLNSTAQQIGAVNTVKIERSNNKVTLKGFNTDCIGFEASLKPLIKPHHKQALVLGTGGASKAVLYVLNKLNIPCITVSSSGNGSLSYTELSNDIISSHQLIINTTPVGMSPDINAKPDIPYDAIGKNHLLYDLIYNPETTAFLNEGAGRNATIINGLQMLEFQAEAAWSIFTSKV